MRRSLFLTLFLRVMAALAVTATIFFVLYPWAGLGRRWLLAACLFEAAVVAVVTAWTMRRSLRRSLAPLQTLAESMS